VSGWPALADEAAAWADAGRAATLWWRDDDASARGPQLDRLADLAARHGAPATLAAIPARLADGFADWLGTQPQLAAIQHGYRHKNHAVDGERASEFPASRPLAARLADLRAGADAFAAAFGAAPGAFTPPWNRIGADFGAALARAGVRLLSVFGPAAADDGPQALHCHLAVAKWKEGARFIGAEDALRRLVEGLRARRTATDPIRASEPFGLLTHHIVHRPETWAFLDRLFGETVGRPGLAWRDWRAAAATTAGAGA